MILSCVHCSKNHRQRLRGLDLRGGIAFTMEATDLNITEDLDQASGASPMDKVVEIMSERLNAFGVAETLVRKRRPCN